jgi:hypothetical protein
MLGLCLASTHSPQRSSHQLHAHSSYSYNGDRTEDKNRLDKLVNDITGVPLAALRNRLLDQFTMSERIRWVKITKKKGKLMV